MGSPSSLSYYALFGSTTPLNFTQNCIQLKYDHCQVRKSQRNVIYCFVALTEGLSMYTHTTLGTHSFDLIIKIKRFMKKSIFSIEFVHKCGNRKKFLQYKFTIIATKKDHSILFPNIPQKVWATELTSEI